MATAPSTPLYNKIWKLVKGFLIGVCVAIVCWELFAKFVPLGYQQIVNWQTSLNDWARGWARPVVDFWRNVVNFLRVISPYLGISIFSVALKRLIGLINPLKIAINPILDKIWKLVKGFLIGTCIAWVLWELLANFAPLVFQQITSWQTSLNDWARGWAGPVVDFWSNIVGILGAISPYLGLSIFSVALKRIVALIIKLIKNI